MSNKRHLPELSYFNAIACLLVVLIHVLSIGISSLERSSWQLALIYFPWRLSAFVVPAFLFSGAVKVSVQMDRPVDYGRYVLGRVKKIWLPYLLWNVIYYGAFLRIGYVRGSIGEFLNYLMAGNLASPFYYVVIVMQLYLLLPLWRWMVRRLPWFIALPCSVLVTFASLQINGLLGVFGLSFPYTDRIFTSYLVFWVMGLYVGQNYGRITKELTSSPGGLVSGAVCVALFAAVSYFQYRHGVYFWNLDNFKVFADCLSIFLLLAGSIAIRSAAGWLRKGLDFVSSASFFVYLSHCLFLTLGTHHLQIRGVEDIAVVLTARFGITYGCAFGAYALWSFLRKKLPCK